MVDTVNHCLQVSPLAPMAIVCSMTEDVELSEEYKWMLDEYPEVFDIEQYKYPVKHSTKHFIPTYGAPVQGRVCRLSPEKLEWLGTELQHLLELDIIAPAFSPYGSPVYMVPKGDGRYRINLPLGDF